MAGFFDHKLHSPNDLKDLTKIPLLGVVGKNESENNDSLNKKEKVHKKTTTINCSFILLK